MSRRKVALPVVLEHISGSREAPAGIAETAPCAGERGAANAGLLVVPRAFGGGPSAAAPRGITEEVMLQLNKPRQRAECQSGVTLVQ